MKRSEISSSSKRLLFDRRYGWIYDEWKNPSQDALAGGRGLFCILPLGTSALHMASELINRIGSTVIRISQKPELLSPQTLQYNLNDQLQKLISLARKPDILFSLETANPTHSHSLPGLGFEEVRGS